MSTAIAIDIDNTLYDFEAAARKEYLKLAKERDDKTLRRGAYNPWFEWRSMSDCCGSEVCHEVIERVHSPAVLVEQTPFEGASLVIQTLSNEHEITIISNRDPETHDATAWWLEEHAIPFDALICNYEDKIPQVSHCQYMIDDRPKTLVEFIHNFTWRYSNPSKKRLAFGLAWRFNQNLTDVPGIYLSPAPLWSGIRYYLEDTGVL